MCGQFQDDFPGITSINSSELISKDTQQTPDSKTPVEAPVADRTAKSDRKLTPQERVNIHSKTLDSKLSAVHTALSNISNAVAFLSESVSILTTPTSIPSLTVDLLTLVKTD